MARRVPIIGTIGSQKQKKNLLKKPQSKNRKTEILQLSALTQQAIDGIASAACCVLHNCVLILICRDHWIDNQFEI